MPNRACDDGSGSSFHALAERVLGKAFLLRTEGRSLLDAELQGLVASLCANARSEGLTAERLLVSLKQAWRSVPAPLDPGGKIEVVAHLVSMCITEYYRDSRSGGKAG